MLRVVAVVEGRRFEVDDVDVRTGRIQFQLERNRQTLVPARA